MKKSGLTRFFHCLGGSPSLVLYKCDNLSEGLSPLCPYVLFTINWDREKNINMKAILGTKLGMSQIFDQDGTVTPVTLVVCAPNVVTQVKSSDRDGYSAVQLGAGTKKNLSKPIAGHVKGLGTIRWLREFSVVGEDASAHKRGDAINVSAFSEKDLVRVTAISKGKGFQGVVKRHGFHGAPQTHGTKNTQRAPGSIGSSFPQHVRKGKRMGGRMGGDQVTRRMHVVKVDAKNNFLLLDGSVPGPKGGLVQIRAVS